MASATVKVPQQQMLSSSTQSESEDVASLTPQERLERLKKLRLDSQRLNRQDVKTESRNNQENPKLEAKLARKREKAKKLQQEEIAEDAGFDIERIKNLKYSAEEVEAWNTKQQQHEEQRDPGFTDYIQTQARKYRKQTSELKPNMTAYREQKAKVTGILHGNSSSALILSNQHGENDFYRDANSLAYADPTSKPSVEAVERMVQDLKKQDEKRANFSRRRAFDEDDDVTYINERNMRFNKKIQRAYGKYTAEVKANFERGTAL